jgi:nitrogenase molybdenum-cofactor synthesis protein NifE
MKVTQSKINELLSESGCEHNQKKQGEKKNKSCTQQAQPGAAQGGCAFDGAMISLVPITDAAHLVHGPIACAGNSWGSREVCLLDQCFTRQVLLPTWAKMM